MASSSNVTLTKPDPSAISRLRQGLRALWPARPPSIPAHYAARLPASVLAAWHALGKYDRRHLVAVADDLEQAGLPDHVVLAGLLHDIGKTGRITIADRAARVLLGRIAPGVQRWLAARERPFPVLDGLHLLLGHAERGADLLESAGMPADVVWLVRHHERDEGGADLRALQAADARQ